MADKQIRHTGKKITISTPLTAAKIDGHIQTWVQEALPMKPIDFNTASDLQSWRAYSETPPQPDPEPEPEPEPAPPEPPTEPPQPEPEPATP